MDTKIIYHAVEGHKAEKLFSLIYGLSLTIMKDIQGVFWGCPRIEALFWPGLGGYVTALTGRALNGIQEVSGFDPAYLHHKENHDIRRGFCLASETRLN